MSELSTFELEGRINGIRAVLAMVVGHLLPEGRALKKQIEARISLPDHQEDPGAIPDESFVVEAAAMREIDLLLAKAVSVGSVSPPGADRTRPVSQHRERDPIIARCDQCGNDYDKAFRVVMEDQTYTFDSFECAIQKLAPTCPHCNGRVIGHGVEQGNVIFCCVHCAEQSGATELRDRAR